MLRTSGALALGLLIGFAGSIGGAQAANKVPAYITAAVADKNRPDTDVKRDEARKPAEVLAFTGPKPGQTIIDLFPGQGYYTRIFSKIVGPKGHVFGVYPGGLNEKAVAGEKAITDDPNYGNVSLVVQPLASPAAAASSGSEAESRKELGLQAPAAADQQMPDWTWTGPKVDMAWTSFNYHDFHNLKFMDLAAMNKGLFGALKPGGIYIVIDHDTARGHGFDDTSTLHRSDMEAVKKEVEAAGFKLVGESNILRNKDDDHTIKVTEPAIFGHTDRYILKFKKP